MNRFILSPLVSTPFRRRPFTLGDDTAAGAQVIRGVHVKDLARLNRDLARTVIVDNSPESYALHPENAVEPKPPLPRTKRTRPPVLNGHVSSQPPY
jgi:hypothetical protein